MAIGLAIGAASLVAAVCLIYLWVMRRHRKREAGKALLIATELGDLAHMRQLLAQGAELNARNLQGWTPLHIAAAGGDVTVLTLLLQHGADVHAQCNIGTTPLYHATVFGTKQDIVDALLAHGARPEGAWDAAF